MKIVKTTYICLVSILLSLNAAITSASEPIHVTYLWHMHQPVYYPYLSPQDADHHFSFSVPGVFNDRSGNYTSWPKDAVQQGQDKGMNHAGAQCSFSGSLVEGLNHLWGNATSAGWDDSYDWARNGLRTSRNNPRLDMVGIAYHHSLMPLTCRESMIMQIKLHKEIYSEVWDTGGEYSKGFWPPEVAFADWMIPALTAENLEWVLVDNIHFDRACKNYEQNIWNSGGSVLRPNKADAINPDPGDWVQLNNVWAPTKVSAPWGYQPHYVQYIDPWSNPASPTVHKIIAVPAARYEGNENGRGGYGAFKPENVWTDHIALNADPNHPMLMVCHSDGDNYGMKNSDAWHAQHGAFLDMCKANGNFDNTTVQDYLEMYPPSTSDIIHVEPGSWAGADAGDPEFKKWNADPSPDGYCPDRFSWSVLVAAQNRVIHAESLENSYSMSDVRWGSGSDTAKAWHFYLNAETSCYWYWDNSGEVWDGNVTRASNLAVAEADKVIARHSGTDTTPPSVYPPQREPYNPGGREWDESTLQPSDFEVWTYVYDVNGLTSVQLVWRTDKDGENPISSYQNELYANGTEVNAWNFQTMNASWFPNKTGDVPDPSYRAQYYTSTIANQNNVLIDYFIQAIDSYGNTNRSDIMHVWVGESSGGGGGNDVVTYSPNPPVRGSNCTITYDSSTRNLSGANPVKIHLGFNSWATVVSPDPDMTGTTGGEWNYTFFVSNDHTQIDCVFTDGGSTWDNNDGNDWHVSTATGAEPPVANFSATPRSGNAPLNVSFTDTGTGIINWRSWQFGDGASSTAVNPTHSYSSTGSYTVTLSVSNAYGASTLSQTNYITVTLPGAPQADFTGTPRYGPPGTTVHFSSVEEEGATITSWNWNFGDGTTSTEENPTHQYPNPGSYSVSLTVEGPGGSDSITKTDYITIATEYISSIDGTNILADFANAPFVLQDTPTGFGDATAPGAGSELDGLYVTNTPNALTIGLTGNLQSNGNCLVLLIDSIPDDGINEFLSGQSHASAKCRSLAGTKLDFSPDYALLMNAYSSEFYLDVESLNDSEYDGYFGTGSGDIYTSRTLLHDATGIRIGFNNANTAGVTATTTNNASTVATGWECELPWDFLHITPPATGTVKIQAFIAGQLAEDNDATKLISNQSLPGVRNSTDIAGQLGSSGGGGSTDGVYVSPNPPEKGQTCTLTYTATGGPLDAVDPVYAHMGFNNWQDAGLSLGDFPMSGTQGGQWTYTFFVSNDWNQIDCVFTDAGQTVWDNNNSADWHFSTDNGVVTFNPNPPQKGQNVTITYNSAGRPLSGASEIFIHQGYNGWNGVRDPRPQMTGSQGGTWSVDIFVSNDWDQIDCVFTTLASGDTGTWDNNDGNDWHKSVATGSLSVGDFTEVEGDQFFAYNYDIVPEPTTLIVFLSLLLMFLRKRFDA